jgi:hypothetical protein
MSGKSEIEWTDATWNPVRACSRVSEGCRNCYAERHAGRLSAPGGPARGAALFKRFAEQMKAGARWTGGGGERSVDQEGDGHARGEAAKSDQPLAKRDCRDVHDQAPPAVRRAPQR